MRHNKISNGYANIQKCDLSKIMTGVVVSVNDPQQMGRIQVMVPNMGHTAKHATDRNLPWAAYCTPFGGVDDPASRGIALQEQDKDSPYGSKTSGPVAYGWWAVPRINARVMVFALDSDPNQLYWFGCIYPNSTPHTMPHGRYMAEGGTIPEGPLSSSESPIQPYYNNSLKAFVNHSNYEWVSRGADYAVAAIHPNRAAASMGQNNSENNDGTISLKSDMRDESITEDDGNIIGKDLTYRQGYALSKINPKKDTNTDTDKEKDLNTDKNLEPVTFSITTPGFHAISMDDRPENVRMRFRTSSGHQIILDDTNERIYISTSEGRNWFEMDADGHIYGYSEESISWSAAGDINFTSEKTIRMTGKKGIHLYSEGGDIRIDTKKDLHANATGKVYLTTRDIEVTSEKGAISITTLDIKTTNTVVEGSSKIHLKTNTLTNDASTFTVKSGNCKIDSSGNIQASGDVSTSTRSLNNHEHKYVPSSGPPTDTIPSTPTSTSASPPSAASAVVAEKAKNAFWTNVVPAHEPWARTFIKDSEQNVNHEPELLYDDPSVGVSMKKSGVENDRKRNPLWHR